MTPLGIARLKLDEAVGGKPPLAAYPDQGGVWTILVLALILKLTFHVVLRFHQFLPQLVQSDLITKRVGMPLTKDRPPEFEGAAQQ